MAAEKAQGSSPVRLVAVVVTHNRLEMLKKTLARLFEAPADALAAVVLVDNASTDGTTAWLATQTQPRLRVLRSDTNLGGAGGFEAGMRLAVRDMDPDWIVVMDDDARPAPGALATFHARDLSRWDAVAAAVYSPDGEICAMNRPAHNPFRHLPGILWGLLTGGGKGFHVRPEQYDGPGTEVAMASFVGFFVSRRAIAMAGYPDPRLFLYGDDGLYTLELHKKGGRIGFEPSIRFDHEPTTFNGPQGQFNPLWKAYYYHRNLFLFYRLAGGWMVWPASLLLVPKWALKARRHHGQAWRYLRLLGWALSDAVTGRLDVDHAAVMRLADTGTKAGTRR